MTYRVRYTAGARDDLLRLFEFLVAQDVKAARRSRKAWRFCAHSPSAAGKRLTTIRFCVKSLPPFGVAGYVALFEIDDDQTVTILAVRHRREDDYY